MITDKTKFRVSYSFLSSWMAGRIDDAINLYFHHDQQVNQAMIDGRAKHDEVEKHILANKALPSWLSVIKLTNPKPEYGRKGELITTYNDLIDLNAIFDCLDEPYLFEFKFGTTDSVDWVRTYQIPFYFLICELKQIEVDRAYLIHHNPHTLENDWIQVWNGREKIEKARNFIETIGTEALIYFNEHKLL